MWTYEPPTNEQVPLLPVRLDFSPDESDTPQPLLSAWQKSISDFNPIELVDELAQAYACSLYLQDALRPLISRTTWHQAADAAWQWMGNWPVEELVASIMFTDIAGFATLMETHPVREVLDSLNDYFTLLSQIVQQHRGDVHKFLGDGLMALFICPTDAVLAGCEIQRAVAAFNTRQAAQGLRCFRTRLAIDTGEVISASVGSPERRDHTLIGRPVNRAAHLSEEAIPETVWISQSTYDRLTDKKGFVSRTVPMAQCEGNLATIYEMTCL